MSYDKILWEDSPSEMTPLNAENLNKMDDAIYSLDEQVTALQENATELEDSIDKVSEDANTIVSALEKRLSGVSDIVFQDSDWSIGAYNELSGMTYTNLYSIISKQYVASENWDIAFTGTYTDSVGETSNKITMFCWSDSKYLGSSELPVDGSYVSVIEGSTKVAFKYEYISVIYGTIESYGLANVVKRFSIDIKNELDKTVEKVSTNADNISANATSISKNADDISTLSETVESITSGDGKIDYSKLKNIPTINSVEVSGAKTGNDLGVIDMPTSNGQKTYGTSGQILSTNGDGTASWVDGFSEGKIVTGKFNYWSTNSKIITNAANITLTTGVWLVIYSFHVNNYESEEIEVTLHFDDYPDGYIYGSTVIASVDENDLKSGKYSNISRIINVTDESVTLKIYGSSSVTITDSRTLQGSISAVLLTPSSTATSSSTDSGDVDPQTDEEQGIATYDEDDELL